MCGVVIIMGAAGYNLPRIQSLSPKKIFCYIYDGQLASLNCLIVSLFRNLGSGG